VPNDKTTAGNGAKKTAAPKKTPAVPAADGGASPAKRTRTAARPAVEVGAATTAPAASPRKRSAKPAAAAPTEPAVVAPLPSAATPPRRKRPTKVTTPTDVAAVEPVAPDAPAVADLEALAAPLVATPEVKAPAKSSALTSLLRTRGDTQVALLLLAVGSPLGIGAVLAAGAWSLPARVTVLMLAAAALAGAFALALRAVVHRAQREGQVSGSALVAVLASLAALVLLAPVAYPQHQNVPLVVAGSPSASSSAETNYIPPVTTAEVAQFLSSHPKGTTFLVLNAVVMPVINGDPSIPARGMNYGAWLTDDQVRDMVKQYGGVLFENTMTDHGAGGHDEDGHTH
jgi:hypothetical protein